MLEKILGLLALRGINQSTLAKRARFDAGRLSYMKKGEWTPSLAVALRIARALGVPLDYLADDAQDKLPTPEFSDDERRVIEQARALRLTPAEVTRAFAWAWAQRGHSDGIEGAHLACDDDQTPSGMGGAIRGGRTVAPGNDGAHATNEERRRSGTS